MSSVRAAKKERATSSRYQLVLTTRWPYQREVLTSCARWACENKYFVVVGGVRHTGCRDGVGADGCRERRVAVSLCTTADDVR